MYKILSQLFEGKYTDVFDFFNQAACTSNKHEVFMTSAGVGGKLISDPNDRNSDKTKKQLISVISYKAEDEWIREQAQSYLELGTKVGNFDFVTINKLSVNDIGKGLSGIKRQAAAEKESTIHEAYEDAAFSGTFLVSTTAIGLLSGGLVGGAIGFVIGLSGVGISFASDIGQTGASLAGVHYEFELEIYISNKEIIQNNNVKHMNASVTSGSMSGQFGGYDEYWDKNTYFYSDVRTTNYSSVMYGN